MGEPISATALTAITISAAAAAAYGQYRAGRATSAAAKNNQRLSLIAAADARRRADFEEYRLRQKVSALVGRQRAAVGASGIAADIGAPALAVEDTLALGELDALWIRNNAGRAAWGFTAQAAQFGAEADAATARGAFGAGATVLGGISSAYMASGSVASGGATTPFVGGTY